MTAREDLTGSVLIAHPTLRDPRFRRTVLFLSHHSEEEGAVGFVLNRPLDQTASEIPGIPEVPMYYGGPVEADHILLACLQWRDDPTVVAFRAFVGRIGEERIDDEWKPGLRAFAGYAGWSSGQLESEIEQQSWIVMPPTREIVQMPSPQTIWKKIMQQSGPMLHFLSEVPDHPERN